jgi:uncharacterized protein YcnI
MIRKSLLAVIVFAIALVVLPAIAGAHVEVAADGSLSADGTQKATLAVPNECVNATTSSVDLNFPATPKLTTVEVAPKDGFTYATTKAADGSVSKLTITGTVSGDGEKDQKEFALTLATISPDTTEIKMTALQNCSDGTVIRWIEPTPANGQEPEHPAPVLEIKSSGATSNTTVKVPVTTKDSGSSDSNTGLVIGGVIAAVVVIGGIAFAVARRKKP